MKKLFSLFCFALMQYTICSAQIVSGTTYKISSYYSTTRSISVQNSSLASDAAVILWTDTDVNTQRWIFTQANDKFFYLTNAYSELALRYGSQRPKAGDVVYQEANDKSDYFQWEFVPVEGNRYREGYFIRFSLQSSGKYLYLEPSDKADGSAIKVQFKKDDADSIRQIWRISATETIPNKLTNAVRGEVMKGWKNRYFNWLKNETTGFWGEAEMIETILDAYETTGNEEYKTMFEQAYEHFVGYPAGWYQIGNGQDWAWNDFNDDIAWAVLASVRAYLMFGEHPNSSINYLTIAKNNYDKMYARALLPSGMLRWKESPAGNLGSNSCINGPAEVAACYLAIATGDNSYYEKAKNLYALQRKHLYDPSTGRAFDSGSWNNNVFTVGNHWVSTYNQGTFLGAALMLYNHYGDEQYKQDAHKIVEWTRKDLCNEWGIVQVCGSGDDLQGFKGILMRYLRRYIVDLAQENSVEWMQRNALHAFNNRNSKGIIWTAWWEKSSENFIFSDGYDFSNKAFGASTAVSAAFNAPLDENKVIKNAYSTIEAEYFDYVRGIFVKSADEGKRTVVENIQENYYTAYHNVDFDGEKVEKVTFRILPASTDASIEIRLGNPSGKLIATVNIPAANSDTWTTVTCPVENVSGRQNVYLVYKGTGFKLDKFWFNEGDEPSGIKEQSFTAPIELYPNPATTDINIKTSQSGKMTVHNATGKQIYSQSLLSGTTNLNVENYAAGMYFINLITNTGKSAVRFLKN